MVLNAEVIETTAGGVAAELARRGVDPDKRVTVTIESPQDSPRSKLADIASRMRRTAAKRGLTTEIFDAILAKP